MPLRTTPLINNEYYHIFNRGVAKMPIYLNRRDYQRFIKSMLYYQYAGPKPKFTRFKTSLKINLDKQIVKIIAYCLMPNHFHFLLQQKQEYGISEFIAKLINSYTKYFNIKHKRTGHLLQGQFKAVHIETNEQLIHLSRYIHLNPFVGHKTKNLLSYTWSSYQEYLGKEKADMCSKSIILDQFKSVSEYEKFIMDQKKYAEELEMIKHQLIDYD